MRALLEASRVQGWRIQTPGFAFLSETLFQFLNQRVERKVFTLRERFFVQVFLLLHSSIELPRKFLFPCGVSRNYEREKSFAALPFIASPPGLEAERKLFNSPLFLKDETESSPCVKTQDEKKKQEKMKNKERKSGKCQPRILKKTQVKFKTKFSGHISFGFSQISLIGKTAPRRISSRIRYRRKPKANGGQAATAKHERKIYGKMKNFRSRTLINITFLSPFSSSFSLFCRCRCFFFTCSTVSRSRLSFLLGILFSVACWIYDYCGLFLL